MTHKMGDRFWEVHATLPGGYETCRGPFRTRDVAMNEAYWMRRQLEWTRVWITEFEVTCRAVGMEEVVG